MTFRNSIDSIIRSELTGELKSRGYIIETDFKAAIMRKYGFLSYNVAGSLRRVQQEMGLTRRRLNSDLKTFYQLQIRGNPVVLLPDESTIKMKAKKAR